MPRIALELTKNSQGFKSKILDSYASSYLPGTLDKFSGLQGSPLFPNLSSALLLFPEGRNDVHIKIN